MIKLEPMTEEMFKTFKKESQYEFANSMSKVELVSLDEALKSALEQFDRLVPQGLRTPNQFFFIAINEHARKHVGYVWLAVSERLDRKVVSINEISVQREFRGQGIGKALMNCIEHEAVRLGAVRIRLHVFNHNEAAKKLYKSMGFQISSLDMFKLLPN